LQHTFSPFFHTMQRIVGERPVPASRRTRMVARPAAPAPVLSLASDIPSLGRLAWARQRMGMVRRGTEAPQGMVAVAQRSGPRREMEAARRMVLAAQRRGAGGRARSGKISAE
jgi:hypothetical protein